MTDRNQALLVAALGLLLMAAQCVYCPVVAASASDPTVYMPVWEVRNGPAWIDGPRLLVQLAATGLVAAGFAVGALACRKG